MSTIFYVQIASICYVTFHAVVFPWVFLYETTEQEFLLVFRIIVIMEKKKGKRN